MIVWLSGVSGVGKATVGEQLQINLKWHYSAVYFLDADICRKNWWPELGLSNRDRTENMLRMARLASFLSRKSNLVIVSCIAPIGPIREEALSICRGSATTKHIYLHASGCQTEQRSKGSVLQSNHWRDRGTNRI